MRLKIITNIFLLSFIGVLPINAFDFIWQAARDGVLTLESLQSYIQRGTNLNGQDAYGLTALHHLIRRDHVTNNLL